MLIVYHHIFHTMILETLFYYQYRMMGEKNIIDSLNQIVYTFHVYVQLYLVSMELFPFIIGIQIFNSMLTFGSLCLHFVVLVFHICYYLSIRTTPSFNSIHINFRSFLNTRACSWDDSFTILLLLIFYFHANVYVTGSN